jgi:DNA-binding transcriptional regulator GbsR (MarR family)
LEGECEMAPAAGQQPLQLTPQALEFVEKISLEYENVYSLPHIGGRILALLLLVSEPISIEDMEKTLQVSHASISTNLRLLSAIGYVEKVTFPGDRCTYFRFLPRSRLRVVHDRIIHYHELKQIINEALRDLNPGENARQNLEEMLVWGDLTIKMNSQFIADWEEYVHSAK